jgi:hypothetical protein
MAAGFQPARFDYKGCHIARKSRLKGGCRQDCLPHIAASRKRTIIGPGRFSGGRGGPIANRPQVANLPHMASASSLPLHKIVAAREG